MRQRPISSSPNSPTHDIPGQGDLVRIDNSSLDHLPETEVEILAALKHAATEPTKTVQYFFLLYCCPKVFCVVLEERYWLKFKPKKAVKMIYFHDMLYFGVTAL